MHGLLGRCLDCRNAGGLRSLGIFGLGVKSGWRNLEAPLESGMCTLEEKLTDHAQRHEMMRHYHFFWPSGEAADVLFIRTICLPGADRSDDVRGL